MAEQRPCRLYQIAWSDETWDTAPAGMLRLDNRRNERPDWAEYWPIRQFLLSESLDEATLYGFLSPRLKNKVPVPVDEILEFVKSSSQTTDVVAFSHSYDLRVMFRNVFEQGEYLHHGLFDLSQIVVDSAMPGVDLRTLINTAETAIYSNYFAATPRFWRDWLAICERIFGMAEAVEHPLHEALNREYFYAAGYGGRDTLQAKVSIIERMTSLILAASDRFKVEHLKKSYLSGQFKYVPPNLLHCLDLMKVTGMHDNALLNGAFSALQEQLLEHEDARNWHDHCQSKNSALHPDLSPSREYSHWCVRNEVQSRVEGSEARGSFVRRMLKWNR